MMIILFFILTICSFLFYGVVGADKTWLLAPLFILNYGLVVVTLFKQARSTHEATRHSEKGTRQTSNLKQPVTTFFWILFLIYSIVMITQATVPFESKLVTLFIGSAVGAYFIWGAELIAFKDNRIVLGLLIFVVMFCALYGLIIHFKCPERVLWLERYAMYEGRLTSTYICPNHFAHLMQMLLPFCLALLFIPQSGLYLKVLSAYSFLVFLPPMFLTESRAGWLGSIGGVGVLICLMALRRSKKLFLVLILIVPVCSCLILLAGWHYSETFQKRAKPVVAFIQQQSEEGVGSEAQDFRPQTWMDTIDMIKEAPLFGYGPGNYRYTFPEYRKRFKGKRIVTGHPHNEYLELVADYGLVGFGLFTLAWIYGCIWILFKSLKAEESRHAYMGFAFLGAAAGTMVHSFFDFQLHVFPNALVFALLAALTVGPLSAVRRRRQTTDDSSQRKVRRENSIGHEEAQGTTEKKVATQREGYLRGKSRRDGANAFEPKKTINIYNQSSDEPRSFCASLWLSRLFQWGLAVGYLIGTVFCLQVMSSAYIRALADKAVKQAVEDGSAVGNHKAEHLYSLAVKIDPQNWRAYKGMGNILYTQRYHCLDWEEKIQLAEQERGWFEKAYLHNPKGPELISAYGKCLIFLGRSKGGDYSAVADDSSSTFDSSLNTQNLTPTEQIGQGLALLREACNYRKFNDSYWWMLGVELRKAGQYEKALDAFRTMQDFTKTPSSRKNVAWLELRLKALNNGEKVLATKPIQNQLPNLQMNQEKTNLLDVFDLMDK